MFPRTLRAEGVAISRLDVLWRSGIAASAAPPRNVLMVLGAPRADVG